MFPSQLCDSSLAANLSVHFFEFEKDTARKVHCIFFFFFKSLLLVIENEVT